MAQSTKCNVEQEGGKTITASHSKCVRKNSGFENMLKEEPGGQGLMVLPLLTFSWKCGKLSSVFAPKIVPKNSVITSYY